jgi:hypothetical protein
MLLLEHIQLLRDKIAKPKGHKPKPNIHPSKLREDAKRKRKSLQTHKTAICEPENIPEGSQRKGYRDFFVQSICVQAFNTLYRRACWQTPDGTIIIGTVPEHQQGSHFGSKLKKFGWIQVISATRLPVKTSSGVSPFKTFLGVKFNNTPLSISF